MWREREREREREKDAFASFFPGNLFGGECHLGGAELVESVFWVLGSITNCCHVVWLVQNVGKGGVCKYDEGEIIKI